MSAPYIVYGVEASYFTRKVLGLLAYKGLPVDFRRKTLMVREEVERRSGTRLMPVVVTPDDEWLWDSTPIALELDRRFPETAVLPPSPLAAIMARILEDFFDEWPTRQAVHFRWFRDADREVGGGSIARDLLGLPQDAPLDAEASAMVGNAIDTVEGWMRTRAEGAGADAMAADEMEGEFIRMIELLERHLATSDFLLGARPSLPDFALYGGLAAHFLHDPTPLKLADAHAPSLFAYRDRLAAARAVDAPPWEEMSEVPETLAPLLQHIALGFHAFLEANRTALMEGRESVTLDFGYGLRTLAVRRYTDKTRRATAAALAALGAEERERVTAALAPLGVLEAYRLEAVQ